LPFRFPTSAEWLRLVRSPITPAVLLFAIGLAIRLGAATSYLYNDEAGGGYTGYGYLSWGYLDTTRVYAGFIGAGRFGSVYSWSFQFGSLTPLTPLLAAIGVQALSWVPSLTAARFTVTVMSSLTACVMFHFGSRAFDKKVGIVAGLVFAIDPIAVLSGRVLYEDAAAVLFGLLSLSLLIESQRLSSRFLVVLSGASLALGFASKELAILFVGAIVLGNLKWSRLGALLRRRNGRPQNPVFYIPWRTILVLFVVAAVVYLGLFPWEAPVIWARLTLLASHTIASSGPPVSVYYMGGLTTNVNPIEYTWTLFLAQTSPWVLVFAIIGIASMVSMKRDTPLAPRDLSLAQNLLVSLVISTFIVFAFLWPIFPHYLLFTLPPAILFSAFGFWQVIAWSKRQLGASGGRSNAPLSLHFRPSFRRSRPRHAGRIISTGFTIAILAVAAVPIATSFEYPGLYYSPFVGGLTGATYLTQINVDESTGVTSAYIEQHYSAGSTVLVFGQVNLFKYLLPEFKVLGPNDIYPAYVSAPIAYLKFVNITVVVVEYVAHQIFPSDPMVLALNDQRPEWTSSYDGLTLASVYNVSVLPGIKIAMTLQNGIAGWNVFQGNLSSNGTFSIGPGYSYAFTESPFYSIPGGCQDIVGIRIVDLSPSATALRVEWANASLMVVTREYFALQPGTQIVETTDSVVATLSSVQFRFVLVGDAGDLVTIPLVEIGC
jgi:4-amino-4-deoxy-L-arabinose transferase-like glycosyltransferase